VQYPDDAVNMSKLNQDNHLPRTNTQTSTHGDQNNDAGKDESTDPNAVNMGNPTQGNHVEKDPPDDSKSTDPDSDTQKTNSSNTKKPGFWKRLFFGKNR
jgi:hypothetical protein